ncbi:hypothetical protein GCM10029964_017490 [Kibdelosporangium lantanae]
MVVSPEPEGAGRLRVLDPATSEKIADHTTADLAGWIARYEAEHHPRWVLPAADALYPDLLEAGVRVARCHDLTLTEGILLAHAGQHGAPRNPAAAWARLHGGVEPRTVRHRPGTPNRPCSTPTSACCRSTC